MNKYIIIVVVKLHSFMQCIFIFAAPHEVARGGGNGVILEFALRGTVDNRAINSSALGFFPAGIFPGGLFLPDFLPPGLFPAGLFPAYPEIDILFFKCIFPNAYWYMNIYYRL